MSSRPFIEVPAFQNILQYTADFIFEHFIDETLHALIKQSAIKQSSENEASLDLTSLFVLLPNAQANAQFIQALVDSLPGNVSAIIPPWSGTLKQWTTAFATTQNTDVEIISKHARKLLFIEALQKHPDLFKEENQWQVTQALLDLFDDLNLNQKQLFNSAEEWQQQLQQAYGLEEQHQHLLHESKLVFTLWHAWREQLSESKLVDETTDYINRLQNAHADLITGVNTDSKTGLKHKRQFICIGYTHYNATEQAFIQKLVDSNLCQMIDYKHDTDIEIDTNPSIKNDVTFAKDKNKDEHTFSNFINNTFHTSSTSLKHRAEKFAKQHPDNTQIPLSTYLASNDEEQVRAIDFFIRQNILLGKNNIAVISEDRKLSRRLRALLERANIALNDQAGWSLATTQASTIIERWLECIEEDFSAYPLLDCLKSPYVSIADETLSGDSFKKNIYRLEHDIIFRENVSGNIEQYKKQLKKRLQRLTHWPQNSYAELINTLDFIQVSARDLTALHKTDSKIHLSKFLNTLLDSLEKLGVLARYQNDDAGIKLLETFEHLKHSQKQADPLLSWQDCRVCLALALENEHFTPPSTYSSVQLMTLEQAAYLNFDCIIFAATEPQHFPGGPNSSPFFNQAVRASLELSTWEIQSKQRLNLFKQTLLAAPGILLTACGEENGEQKPVSPWLELLINFYQLAYHETTENADLVKLTRAQTDISSPAVVDNGDSTEDKIPHQTMQASSVLPIDLIPERLSASAYQRLINCPYQYFSADGLQLKPLEEISEELKKADYGERIHLILQCFHNGHENYGNAYPHAITTENKKQAEDFLSALSEKIFLRDLDNNVLHRSWLYRWQKHIPAYVNWQIKQQMDWQIFESEANMEVNLAISPAQNDHIKIYGRLDRIDKSRIDNSHAIIDYKTGKCAHQEDVDAGENVQLSTYALLDEQANNVSYLSLDSSYQKVETRAFLADEDLNSNREQNRQRLSELFTQIQNQESLLAWGDDNVCRYCNFSGLCRKQEWME